MTLYLLRRVVGEDGMGWDETREVAVRASSERHARQIAATVAGDEGGETWLTAVTSTCDVVTEDGEAGVVCRDFRAG